MDSTLYDEFGNYIGPSLSDDGSQEEEDDFEDEEESEGDDDEEAADRDGGDAMDAVDTGAAGPSSTAIVLHEDKKYYPTAEEVYGEGVETLVMDEDAQPLEVPIVARAKETKFEVLESGGLESKYPLEFMASLMGNPELTRNVAVAGHLHHGKTVLLDTLITETHYTRHESRSNQKQMRYTDSRLDEQTREISIKMTPVTLVLQSLKGKSYLMNLLDTPGHLNFADEVTAAIQTADGCLLCVDAVEGVMLGTEQVIKQALLQRVPLVLCTKLDRLITELKVPPKDAYIKLRHIVDECNQLLDTLGGTAANAFQKRFDPALGNVAFSCGLHNFSFTLQSFAHLYTSHSTAVFDYRDFAARMWGDIYFHKSTRAFRRTPEDPEDNRTFITVSFFPLHACYLFLPFVGMLKPLDAGHSGQHPPRECECCMRTQCRVVDNIQPHPDIFLRHRFHQRHF
jgi:116 kDa U5 small nuclear ribonucleoprotein component